MDIAKPFLSERTPRPLTLPRQTGLEPKALYIGNGQNAFEVAVVDLTGRPAGGPLQAAWKERRGGRASPVLLVALYGDHAALCGPAGDNPPVLIDVDRGQAERLCRASLDQPDRHAALAFLSQALPSLETAVPGLRNEGLFALHALVDDAKRRPEWHAARTRPGTSSRAGVRIFYRARLPDRQIRQSDLPLARWRAACRARDIARSRRNTRSRNRSIQQPVAGVLRLSEGRCRGVTMGRGAARRSVAALSNRRRDRGRATRRTETYVEVQTSLLADEHLAYLWLLFSAEGLDPKGAVAELLDASKRFAGDLAVELRERIYEEVLPRLASAIADARGLKNPSVEELDLTYRMALTVLFRLLFIAYAEDRDLLPYSTNEAYRRRSLKQKAQELAEAEVLGPAAWQRQRPLARGRPPISCGKDWQHRMGRPAYDGGLFTAERRCRLRAQH